jgi:hypothetical protein
MPIPAQIVLETYSSLWSRLQPKIQDEIERRASHLVEGRFATLEEAKEIVGFLRGIRWILTTADDLMRIDGDG